jgi:glycosyltransferase involved in cell wall biosynthesis
LAGADVDYYYVTAFGKSGTSAMEFGRTLYWPGLRSDNRKHMPEIFGYLGGGGISVTLVVLPIYPLRFLFWLSRMMFYRIGLSMRKKGYDLINIVGQEILLLDLHRGLGDGCNVVHSLHEAMPHYDRQNVNYPLINYLMGKGKRVIVHSAAVYAKLASSYAGAMDNVAVIPFGVFETYRLYGASSDERIVRGEYYLFYGMIMPYKGLDILYSAAMEAGEALGKFKIVVAGAGEDESLRLMEADGRFVVLHRYLSNADIVNLVRNCRCVVCPYKSASQSGVTATAFLFGKPVIASDAGGFRESIRDGVDGLLVRPGDSRDLASALMKASTDDELVDSLGRGAAEFQRRPEHSWTAIARKYLDLLKSKRP